MTPRLWEWDETDDTVSICVPDHSIGSRNSAAFTLLESWSLVTYEMYDEVPWEAAAFIADRMVAGVHGQHRVFVVDRDVLLAVEEALWELAP